MSIDQINVETKEMFGMYEVFETKESKEIREIKLCCITCPKQCEMTLLMEGFSVLFVKGDGCKKGQKFAYREMKNRRNG